MLSNLAGNLYLEPIKRSGKGKVLTKKEIKEVVLVTDGRYRVITKDLRIIYCALRANGTYKPLKMQRGNRHPSAPIKPQALPDNNPEGYVYELDISNWEEFLQTNFPPQEDLSTFEYAFRAAMKK